jgi:hypothetical protein
MFVGASAAVPKILQYSKRKLSGNLCRLDDCVLKITYRKLNRFVIFRVCPLNNLLLTGRDRRVGAPAEVIGVNNRLRFVNPEFALFDPRHGIGSTIIVRKDGKPLCHAHLEVFVQYGKEQWITTGAFVPSDISMCSKEDFMAWYAERKEEMKDTGTFDVDVPTLSEL